ASPLIEFSQYRLPGHTLPPCDGPVRRRHSMNQRPWLWLLLAAVGSLALAPTLFAQPPGVPYGGTPPGPATPPPPAVGPPLTPQQAEEELRRRLQNKQDWDQIQRLIEDARKHPEKYKLGQRDMDLLKKMGTDPNGRPTVDPNDPQVQEIMKRW